MEYKLDVEGTIDGNEHLSPVPDGQCFENENAGTPTARLQEAAAEVQEELGNAKETNELVNNGLAAIAYLAGD